ncbi:MAG: hypothetical protein KIG65_07320 [Eubacteriales bacterium]|nr:hypothetical protein [Eubacteriales bacterium]
MNRFGCGCNNNCTALAILASIILGVVAAFLRITAVITVTPAFLWVALGIAVVYLGVILVTSALARGAGGNGCICQVLPILLTGILGAALTAVILLAITFAATSIVGAIITGALILFLSLILTVTACLIRCLFSCDD